MKTTSLILFLMLALLLSCEGERIDYSIINRSINVNARIEGSKTRATNDTRYAPIGVAQVVDGMVGRVEN